MQLSPSGRMLLARGIGGMALIIPCLTVITVARQGIVPTDVLTYLAGGERLNAGHHLYALVAGDRPIKLEAVYGYSPLLSPPLVAIAFRPLALLGDIGAWIWWLSAAGAMLGLLAWIVWRAPLRGGLAVAVLTVPIYWQVAMGNVNALVAVLLAVAWRTRGTASSGVAITIAAALKVVPLALLLWSRQWRSVALAVLVLAAVSLAGAGVGNTFAFAGSASSAQPASLSVGAFMVDLGLPQSLGVAVPYAILIVGSIVAYWLPVRSGFVVGVVTMVIGSPAVNIHSFALLVLLVVPFIDSTTTSSRHRALPEPRTRPPL